MRRLERDHLASVQKAIGTPAAPPDFRWSHRYARRLLITDVLLILVAVGGSHLFWFGLANAKVLGPTGALPGGTAYWMVSLGLIVGWLIALEFEDTRDARVIGFGPMEYKRIGRATLAVFGVIATLALMFQITPARGYIITALPMGIVLLVGGRWAWRQYLVRRRLEGDYSVRTLIVGSRVSVDYLATQLNRFPAAGYRPVGVCVPDLSRTGDHVLAEAVSGLPVLGDLADVAGVARREGAEIVILTSSDSLPPTATRTISWALERSGIQLGVAPAMTEIAGPRIHTRPIAGLPILHVEVPRYEGSRRVVKAAFDWTIAAFLLVFALLIILPVAVIIKLDSPGPVFFRQERVGLNGRVFRMIKFRTMVVDAEARLDEFADANQGAGLLFKMKDDPRVTRTGRWIRRFSLDEVPQLFNVILGDMSIVGPRPPLVREAAEYEPDVRRRLLVKPGMTGPWQISGRSDLSWDEGVRLDLYYVENWSLPQDFILLLRTAKAVLSNRGAY